ncbi:Ubl carboxyl-terminal hydrolase 18 [Turdus rufiventris]|nr:Ubl carboxyl-terminal hydrolase 18 [Turdus rufiventris]
MGQVSGRQERSKKPEVALSETMEAEIEVQNNEEEIEEVKAKSLKLTSVFGVADLKNEAVGLYNLGLTCCLNSLLQVFFMNIHFTRILRRITVPSSPAKKRSSVPYQMLLLLENMQCGKCKAVCPRDLAYCLSEHRVKLFVQYDAAQLFLTLWNLLKKQIRKPELVEELSDLYTICIQEHLACQKCSFEIKRNSTMLTLPLPVLDANSHKLRTLSMKLVHLPHTLTLHLKRFCFERSSHTLKLGHSLQFPQELDFREVLTKDQCQADDSEKATWQYELFAVVAHSGSTDFGHYCAYIRSLTECKWYCFNDSQVCQVSWDDVKCTYGRSNFNWYANVSLVSPDAALDFGMRGSKEREDKWFGLHVAWGVVGMQEICQSGFLHAFWFDAS